MNLGEQLASTLQQILEPNQIDPILALQTILDAAVELGELEIRVCSNEEIKLEVEGKILMNRGNHIWSKFRMVLSRFGSALLQQKPDPNYLALFGFNSEYIHVSGGRNFEFEVECENKGETKPRVSLKLIKEHE